MTTYDLFLSFFLAVLLTALSLIVLLPSVARVSIALPVFRTLILGLILVFLLSSTIVYAYKGDLCEIILLVKSLQTINPFSEVYGLGNAYFGLWILKPIFESMPVLYLVIGSGFLLLAILIKTIYPYRKSIDLDRSIPLFSIVILVMLNRYAQQIFAVPRTAVALALAAVCVYMALGKSHSISNKPKLITKFARYSLGILFSILSLAFHPIAIILLLPIIFLLFAQVHRKNMALILLVGLILPIAFTGMTSFTELYRGEAVDALIGNTKKIGFWTPLSLMTAIGMTYSSTKHYNATVQIKQEYQSRLTQYINIFALLFSPLALISAFDNSLERFNLVWSIFFLLTICNLSKLGKPHLSLLAVYLFISILGSSLLSTELSGKVIANDFMSVQRSPECSLPLTVYSPIYHPYKALQSSYEAALRFDMTSTSNK
jgi:hypothetical protein